MMKIHRLEKFNEGEYETAVLYFALRMNSLLTH